MLIFVGVFCLYVAGVNGLKLPSHLSFSPKRCLSSVKESFGKSRLFSSTSPTEEQKKSGLGWDSHQAIEEIPESLVRTIDGNDSMRRKFEALCRGAQVNFMTTNSHLTAKQLEIEDHFTYVFLFIN
jgi:hypothetical protein